MSGGILGIAFALGLALIGQVLRPRKVSLANRISPYVGNFQVVSPSFAEALATWIKELGTLEPWAPWATDEVVTHQLRQVRSPLNLVGFRRSQLIAAGWSALAMAIWILLRLGSGKGINPLAGIIFLLAALATGGWFQQWRLNEAAKSVLQTIERQLPSVLELLAFAVAAGEPVLLALRRVTQTCTGPFVAELRELVYAVNSGEGLVAALDRLQADLGSQAVSRSTHALNLALERGTPLAQVLRAQASDARAHEARMLLTLAGKKETAMMLPVIFLILPMIVGVALYPGLLALQAMQ
ncbi:MAG: type II secretion system F family protein [Actinomycetes bacterium]